jgi:DNA-binding NtrC family response regulator/tetratricopeptide (TPR) repeat protein
MNELSHLLLNSEDKFASILGCAHVHRIVGDREQRPGFRRELLDLVDSSIDRAAIDLGLLYVGRRFDSRPATALLNDVESIILGRETDEQLMLRARLTRAAILSTNASDYRAALDEFKTCVSESMLGDDHFAYALANKGVGDVSLCLGLHSLAEEPFENALVTFRRYNCELLGASVTNSLGLLKKRWGEYSAALRLLQRAHSVYRRLAVPSDAVYVGNNVGFVFARMGDWGAAQCWFESAEAECGSITEAIGSNSVAEARWACATPLPHLFVMRRQFAKAEQRLSSFLEDGGATAPHRVVALAHEFLAELCLETMSYEKALSHLEVACSIARTSFPNGDVMSEVLRRQAQLLLELARPDQALETARRCIQLSRKIGDRYELGAATRVLGEVYAAQGNVKRAAACFRSAVNGLKSIHECYELMRTLYAQGVFLGKQGKRDDAEVSLLEARQLAKKLELDYYQALIAVALVDTLAPQERFTEASTWLAEATALRDNLEGIDLERVERAVKASANNLQQVITRASVREAETLKTICRVYEDARFPIVEMKPDLAYQIAQSVGGACLFVIGRKGGGLNVPLTYNISVGEAKELVRQLEGVPKKPFLGLESDAQVLQGPKGRTIVAVPCHVALPGNGKDKTLEMYAFCTCFDQTVPVTSRQMEILYASSEVLSRLIEDEDERHEQPTADEIARARHPRGSFKDILTIDPGMIKVIKQSERAASSVAPILLEGETGVGKELFARAIHEASKRKDGPFVAVNAGGMSLSLLESELFGHVRGAFTDASTDRMGFVDTARGGTLFLDEIGETSEELQVKLLRLIENGEYRRLGESSMRKADVRFISATNRDLSKEVERGRFRRDLFYRVAPLRLTIPPLRMRASDIQLMVRHFLRDCAQMNGIADRYIEIDVKAMEALELYDWPGNVRELFNEMLRVVSLIGRGDLVRFSMLSDHIQEYLHAKRRGTEGLLERSVEQYERRLILHALERNDWNHLRTAEKIGVPRTTLLAKLKRLNIASKL